MLKNEKLSAEAPYITSSLPDLKKGHPFFIFLIISLICMHHPSFLWQIGQMMQRRQSFSTTFLRDLSNLPTAYFALVMATGIVSIAAFNFNFILIAHLLFYFNIAAYLFLVILYFARLILYPAAFVADAGDHAKGLI